MKSAQKLLEIETMLETLLKKSGCGGLLRYKVLYYASMYEHLSVGMIIEKLGLKKSNFALLTAQLEKDGLLEIKQTEFDRRCRTLVLTSAGQRELDNFFLCFNDYVMAMTPEEEAAVEKVHTYFNKRT